MVAIICVSHDWPIRQRDVEQVYIRADEDVEVHMKVLEGYGEQSGEIVWLNQKPRLRIKIKRSHMGDTLRQSTFWAVLAWSSVVRTLMSSGS